MSQIASLTQMSLGGPLFKWALMVLFMMPWLRLATWVNDDVLLIRAHRTKWNALACVCGGVGMLLWLVMPASMSGWFYLVGMLFYVVLAAGGLLAYVAYRNDKVEPHLKVLTREHLTGLLSSGKKGAKRKQMEIVTKVTIYDNYEKMVFPPDIASAEEKDVNNYNHVQDFLFDVTWRRASEVVVAPSGANSRVVFVIDGVVHERPAIPLAQAEEMIQFLKEIAGMEVDEVRRPQKGKLSVDCRAIEATVDMELSVAGTTGGQRLVFRIIQEVARTSLAQLGMPDDILGQISSIAQTRNGLFICSGRKGSGVTSTLYSMLRHRDVYMTNVATVESKPALELENITQHKYAADADLPRTLSIAVKQGLDVLMVDQCPDSETAKMIVDISAKKPVLLGMQASDSFSALAKWVQLVGDPASAVPILRGVLCQMLVRQLCEKCKVAYAPDAARLAKLNLASEKIENFYRPPSEEEGGEAAASAKQKEADICPACQGSGYKGRMAVYELLKLTPEIRQLIVDGATVAQIRAACRKNKMLYLQEMAMKRVIDGTTSVQEVIRVTQLAAKK